MKWFAPLVKFEKLVRSFEESETKLRSISRIEKWYHKETNELIEPKQMLRGKCLKESLLQNYLRSQKLLENKATNVVVEAAGDQSSCRSQSCYKSHNQRD